MPTEPRGFLFLSITSYNLTCLLPNGRLLLPENNLCFLFAPYILLCSYPLKEATMNQLSLSSDQAQEILARYQLYLDDYAEKFGFKKNGGFITRTQEYLIKAVDELDAEENFGPSVVLGVALLQTHQQLRDHLHYRWGIKLNRLKNSIFHNARDIVGWLAQHFPFHGWAERQKQIKIIEELTHDMEFNLEA